MCFYIYIDLFNGKREKYSIFYCVKQADFFLLYVKLLISEVISIREVRAARAKCQRSEGVHR